MAAAGGDDGLVWVTVDIAHPPSSEDDLGFTPAARGGRYGVRAVGAGDIPHDFLRHFKLKDIDLTGLQPISVGDRFLVGCVGLTAVDLSPLRQVTCVAGA